MKYSIHPEVISCINVINFYNLLSDRSISTAPAYLSLLSSDMMLSIFEQVLITGQSEY